ncbi:heme NO-binding domain-containing protein [Adhaeribacter aquaticus]|uniref:heme NO-binding domain-containing protein n=1 Tax=Adhaeribacter aquaticus TaxID=299567 RepID=UPI0004199450|nr:heme NO-binding domain-containing protein [Adhaeribacter aquaticus]
MKEESIAVDRMHGSIYILLKRFVEGTYDYSTWIKLLEAAGIDHAPYKIDEMYPTQEIYAIVTAASTMTGIPAYDLTEKFGEYLVPDLLLMYNKFINPEWTTYNMLLNTESTFHGAVKQQDGRTSPPILQIKKVGEKQLLVDYYSKRRMAGVAVGIIKGIANYYQESDTVKVTRLTHESEEQVQIKVDFLN